MASALHLHPLTGTFDLTVIEAFLKSIPGKVRDTKNRNFISFDPEASHDLPPRDLDIGNPTAVEHGRPFIELAPHEISIGLNWSDTPRGDIRKFLVWLLATVPCRARDHDGFDYAESSACSDWMEVWLPE